MNGTLITMRLLLVTTRAETEYTKKLNFMLNGKGVYLVYEKIHKKVFKYFVTFRINDYIPLYANGVLW